MGVTAILKFATASLSDMISQKSTVLIHHIAGLSLGFMSSYCANEGIFACTISMISSHSEEPVANFNIANLKKSAEEFLPNKKASPDLNL